MNLADLQPLLSQLPALATATGITLAGRKAIARLVNGVGDLAMIPIDTAVQGAKDKRDSRSIVSKALAEAVAKSVSADPELVERAAIAQLGEAVRKQQAREKVAEVAVEELTKATEREAESAHDADAQEIDEDWMNVFVGYAERASSERLQQMWGRVLAGEINKPDSFSMATLRTISELSSTQAGNFEKIANSSVGNTCLRNSDIAIVHLLDLEAAGLLAGVSPGMIVKWNAAEVASAIIAGDKYYVFMKSSAAGQIEITRLTEVGRQCAKLISGIDEHKNAIEIARSCKSTHPNNEVFVGIDRGGTIFKLEEL
jgi:hypothetical protein